MTTSTPTAEVGVALPAYHLAPVLLEEPEDMDRAEPMNSATRSPHRAVVRSEFAQLSTRRLTHQVMQQVLDTGTVPEASVARGTLEDPMAAGGGVTVYTPAQIRAAYGLPVLPALTSTLTSAQVAQFGAGQTIYLIDAQDDPNAAAELASFNSKFGLPGCFVSPVLPSTTLPLPAAPLTGCVFSVVYTNTNGAVVSTAPAYSAGWATEIALDVQWAHAIAPYARIVLIEAPDASVTSLSAAVHVANLMGPGIVSQSFGSQEGSWTAAYDAPFTVANMTYLAAAGDSGTEVEWPAVSSHVLAVAGTSLSYMGTGSRSESVWSGTGGGVSAYVATPSYQSLAVPGLNPPAHRAVSDIAFNSDPYTGQYIAVIAPGTSTPAWLSAGGTSLATPQWGGIIAVANAIRAQSNLAPVGAAHSLLYGLATASSTYTSNFLDVTKGSDGTCSTCNAGIGYDLPSGLGTPNVASLLAAVTGAVNSPAPIVSSAAVSGKAGTALSFSISATDAHPLTYSLLGAPTGMSVNASTGVVGWGTPVAGSYSVVATAFDALTGLSGQGTYSVSIVAPLPPQVAGGAIAGTAQTALTFSAQVTDANTVTYTLSGAPSGMTVSSAGIVSWAAPLAGTYTVAVIAHDATTGLSGQGIYTVAIAAQKAPAVPAVFVSGTQGKALSFVVNVASSDTLTYSLTGAPPGMSIVSTTGLLSWSVPTVGTYFVTVAVKDTKSGLIGSGVYTISIAPSGPAIAATTLAGVAGQAMTGTLAITDNASTSLSISISGMPAGMNASVSGNVLTMKWAIPVTGTYSLRVTVIDSKGNVATATVPAVITAH